MLSPNSSRDVDIKTDPDGGVCVQNKFLVFEATGTIDMATTREALWG